MLLTPEQLSTLQKILAVKLGQAAKQSSFCGRTCWAQDRAWEALDGEKMSFSDLLLKPGFVGGCRCGAIMASLIDELASQTPESDKSENWLLQYLDDFDSGMGTDEIE